MNHQESFINYLKYEKRNSPHTVVSYQKDLEQFTLFCEKVSGESDLTRCNRKIVREWVVGLMEEKLSPRTVHRKISTLQAFFKYLMKMEVIDVSPVHDIPLPKIRKKLPVFVEENSLHHLLDDGFFDTGYKGERDKLVISLLYGTGIRLSELLNLTEKEVDLAQCQIKVTGKRNKQRLIPFPRSMKNQIENYLLLKHEEFPVAGSGIILTDKGESAYAKLIYRIVNNYLTQVTLLDKRSPHVLRHTYATHLLNKGADLNAVKELLGHSNLGATEIYTHTTFEKLHSIYQQAHPRG